MKVLVADDDAVSRRLLQMHVSRMGLEVVTATTGTEAWNALQEDRRLSIAILDWMMPGLDGVALCRRLRHEGDGRPLHLILCTARDATGDIVEALDAGANDYLTKPARPEELRARLRVGVRSVELEQALQRRITELGEALAHVKRLQGLLPICMHCKSIRTGPDAWLRIETYLSEHAEVKFSHGLCDDCLGKLYPDVPPASG